MGILSSLKSAVTKTLDITTFATAHPITSISSAIKGTYAQEQAKFYTQPVSKQITQIITTTGTAALAVVGAGAVGTAAKAGTLTSSASKLIPTTIKGKIIGAVATPIVAGVIISQPLKAAEAISKTPAALTNVGANIGNLVANPSLSNVKTLFTENPLLVGGAVAGAAILGAKTIIPAITSARQIEATQEQTKAIEGATAGLGKETATGSVFGNEAKYPQTPATTEVKPLTNGTTRRKTRRTSKTMPQIINQRVNVMVSNRSSSVGIRGVTHTNKYLNREMLIN